MPSHNVTFDGSEPALEDDEFAEPEGAAILLALRPVLEERGWQPLEVDIFHGAWGFLVKTEETHLQLVLTGPLREGGSDWFIQIAWDGPGIFGRLFGKDGASTESAAFDLAREVHTYLQDGGFTNMRWSDGPPTDDSPEAPQRSY